LWAPVDLRPGEALTRGSRQVGFRCATLTAGDIDTRKSTSDIIFLLGYNPITCKSFSSSITTQSHGNLLSRRSLLCLPARATSFSSLVTTQSHGNLLSRRSLLCLPVRQSTSQRWLPHAKASGLLSQRWLPHAKASGLLVSSATSSG
jgi:hypothetical protein